jgi:hypothetical protein
MMTRALRLRTDICDLAPVADPYAAARLVCWMGLDSVTGKVPVQKEDESREEYVVRIWDRLKASQRQQAIEAGLQKAAWYAQGLDDGRRIAVYETYINAWIPFDHDREFRSWVADFVGGEEPTNAQYVEASKLATTILNVTWLDANGFDLSAGDDGVAEPVEVFAKREKYNRWARVAPRMKALIEAANHENPGGEIDDEINELIETVNDPDKSAADLDEAGRKGAPRIPPLIIIESAIKDDLGRRLFYGAATPAQWTMLKQKMGRSASLELAGQEYDADRRVLVEYRFHEGYWSERVYRDDWSGWKPIEKPELAGRFDSKHEDPELGVVYLRYWEERERKSCSENSNDS